MVIAGQNGMSLLKSFTKFPELPPELQLQIWESNFEIRGSLFLRGNLKNLDLQIPGQNPEWTVYTTIFEIYIKRDWFRKYVLNVWNIALLANVAQMLFHWQLLVW